MIKLVCDKCGATIPDGEYEGTVKLDPWEDVRLEIVVKQYRRGTDIIHLCKRCVFTGLLKSLADHRLRSLNHDNSD